MSDLVVGPTGGGAAACGPDRRADDPLRRAFQPPVGRLRRPGRYAAAVADQARSAEQTRQARGTRSPERAKGSGTRDGRGADGEAGGDDPAAAAARRHPRKTLVRQGDYGIEAHLSAETLSDLVGMQEGSRGAAEPCPRSGCGAIAVIARNADEDRGGISPHASWPSLPREAKARAAGLAEDVDESDANEPSCRCSRRRLTAWCSNLRSHTMGGVVTPAQPLLDGRAARQPSRDRGHGIEP